MRLLADQNVFRVIGLACKLVDDIANVRADSEVSSAWAICEYPISSYLCIKTAARCFAGSAAIESLISCSLVSFTMFCSTNGV